MKKFLILGAFLLVATVGVATELQTELISDASECPVGCETSSATCCKTRGGSTYYGKL